MMYRAGIDERAPERVVKAASEDTSPLLTRDMFRACIHRALWIQGAAIVVAIGGIIGIAEFLG